MQNFVSEDGMAEQLSFDGLSRISGQDDRLASV